MALKTNFAINIVCEQYHSDILGGTSDSLHVVMEKTTKENKERKSNRCFQLLMTQNLQQIIGCEVVSVMEAGITIISFITI